MANTKEIKQKIDSVANLKKITKAMEMVARSKMKKATDAAVATRTYAELALELLVNLSTEDHRKNPYLSEQEGKKILVLHIASNKGLCGGYNVSLLRALNKYFEKRNEEINFVTVGRYAYRHALKLADGSLERFDDFSDNIEPEETNGLVDKVLETYKSGEYKETFIVYTNFVSIFSQEVVIRKLLPLSEESLESAIKEAGAEGERTEDKKDKAARNRALYLYEPNEEDILDFVVPRLIKVQIYQALLEANASEHSARMVAMKSATENADKRGEELTLQFNKARQEGITKEILEIASGAEALSQ
ncbi:MAG: ATP synthase F1 subunit gamma [Candidatus Spechtbacterales bacterium]|nr:ATP synthase F1 subunit gamma [Candidatus Spechtbacterales bacterium]